MNTPWETEEEEEGVQTALRPDAAMSLTARQLETMGKQVVNPEYKTKAYLVLVDSDSKDWGMVEDTLDDLLWQPGKGEIVGTWSRPRYSNVIHISLCTAINALQDRSVQTFARLAEERRQKEQVVSRPSRRAQKAAAPVEEPTPELSVDEKLRFNSLRARLGRAK